jgi:hypothetical protein
MFLVMCSMAMLYFKAYSSTRVLHCGFIHILLPRVNCKQLYLRDNVYRAENWGSRTHATDNSSVPRCRGVSTGT